MHSSYTDVLDYLVIVLLSRWLKPFKQLSSTHYQSPINFITVEAVQMCAI